MFLAYDVLHTGRQIKFSRRCTTYASRQDSAMQQSLPSQGPRIDSNIVRRQELVEVLSEAIPENKIFARRSPEMSRTVSTDFYELQCSCSPRNLKANSPTYEHERENTHLDFVM